MAKYKADCGGIKPPKKIAKTRKTSSKPRKSK